MFRISPKDCVLSLISSHSLLIRIVYIQNNAGLAGRSTDLSLLLVTIKILLNITTNTLAVVVDTKVGTLKKLYITEKRFPNLFFITPKEIKKKQS